VRSAGALVYQPCPNDDCAPYLVLADGRQFRLGAAPASGGPRPPLATLSPDGRWLGQYGPEGYGLRDLASTDQPRAVEGTPIAWSPDSRWLLTEQAGEGTDRRYALLEVASGATHALAIAPDLTVVGVLPSGDVVVVPPTPGASPGHLAPRILDGRSGAQRREVSVDLIPADSRYQWFSTACCLAFAPDGRTVTIQLTWPADWDSPNAPRQRPPTVFAVLDLDAAKVTHRWELPDHRQVTDRRRPPDFEAWDVRRALSAGVVLSHQRGPSTLELVLLNPATGARRVASHAPNVYLEVPGGVLGSVLDS
jgi:hypothetical protein